MGVTHETLEAGDGVNYPKVGDKLTINYDGTLKDSGKKFDSSYDRNEPFKCTIGVGQLIKGWDEGILKLSLGEKAKLTITSDYGYGRQGHGSIIPPNSDLVFIVQLLEINGLKST